MRSIAAGWIYDEAQAGGKAGVIEAGTRRIGLPFMAGLIVSPLIFAWLLLRRGYAPSTRRAAFTYGVVTFALALCAQHNRREAGL
jgi:hypothetical protein